MSDHLEATLFPVCHVFNLEVSHVVFFHACTDMEFQRLVQIVVQTEEGSLFL